MSKKPVGGYRSTRETYKAVKRYDHQQFDDFCTRIYENGYRDGMQHPQEELERAVDMEKVLEVVENVKGVGPALAGRIRTAVDELLTEKARQAKKGEQAQ